MITVRVRESVAGLGELAGLEDVLKCRTSHIDRHFFPPKK